MNGEFQILTLREENALTLEERHNYYDKLRDFVLKRKLTNTTKGATSIAPKLKKLATKAAVVLTKLFADKNVEWVWEGYETVPDGAVIFAHTHQGVLDNFVWMPEVEKHCLILHNIDVGKAMLMAEWIDGLVLVKKGDKKNNQNAKLDMIKLLLQGHSITYFPESAWNLSPNKLHLPLNFGFLDTAKKAKVPVIPVVHEYTYDNSTEKERITKIHTRFGKPIYVREEDDLSKKLQEYEECISTIRYELIEEKGIFKRSEITNLEYINYLKGNYNNLAFGKIDINNERKHLYNANDEFYKFHHINDIPFNEHGVLLETEEVRKLKRINRREKLHRK